MKFILMFKTPDVLDQLDAVPEDVGVEIARTVARYVKYGEYIRVEFDTETQTATVLEN